MARKLSALVLLVLVLIEKVISLTLVANYKYWKSVSRELVYDYSGNTRHGTLWEEYVVTDRGLSPYPKYVPSLMSHAFLSSNEYTISLWVLNHNQVSSFDIHYYNKYGIEYKAFIVKYDFTSSGTTYLYYHDQVTTNSYTQAVSNIEGWNFHTVRMYQSIHPTTGNIRVHIEQYLNLATLYSTDLDLSIAQISICIIHMGIIDPIGNTGLIIYETWVHLGFSSILELSDLISNYCGCANACPTSPSITCLPSYGKFQNKQGDLCSSNCTDSLLSCTTKNTCILKSITTCPYKLYDLASMECVFYCPENSCICSTNTTLNIFECSCIVGYKSISRDPPACISSRCLTYHAVGYKYVCDSTETGYILDGNGECCICDADYTEVLSNPLVCMNILHCIEYTKILGYSHDYVCSACEEGYLVDINGSCNHCDTDYVEVSDNPFTCALKIENCIYYIYKHDSWICKECKRGYSVDTNGECYLCQSEYFNQDNSHEDLNCKPEIDHCIEYDLTPEESKCKVCEIGYSLDSNSYCTLCAAGYISIESDSKICTREILNCKEYKYSEEGWSCKECIGGFSLYNSNSSCVTEINYCSTYIQDRDSYLCEKCEEGYRLDCGDVCMSSNKCICADGNKECMICPDNCTSCVQIEENIECLNCIPGYNLIDSDCELISGSQSANELNLLKRNSAIISTVGIITSISVSMISLNINNILSVMGTIQILSYILLYNLTIPIRAVTILEGMTIINIVPNIFEYFIPDKDTLDIERFNRLDINNELFLINSGNMLTSLTIILISILLLKIISRFTFLLNDASFIKKSINRLLGSLRWNFVIGFLIQGSLELTTSSLLNLYYVSFSDIYSIIGFSISAFVFVIYIQIAILLSPLKLLSFYLTNYEQIKNNSLDTKFSILYDNLKSDQLETLFLNILELLRRIVYGVNIILLYSSPYIQVVANSSFSIAISYYILLLRPYKSKLDYIMNLYIEFNTFLSLTIIGVFLNEDLPRSLHDVAEWAFVILIYLSIMIPAVVNTIVLIIKIIFKRQSSSVQTQAIESGGNTKIDLDNKF